jgi:hypothetical protein
MFLAARRIRNLWIYEAIYPFDKHIMFDNTPECWLQSPAFQLRWASYRHHENNKLTAQENHSIKASNKASWTSAIGYCLRRTSSL